MAQTTVRPRKDGTATPPRRGSRAVNALADPWRTLLDLGSEGAFTLDRQGRVEFCNAPLARLLGDTGAGVTGTALADWSVEGCRADLEALLGRAQDGECQGEAELRTRAGETVPVRVTLAPVAGAGGTLRVGRVVDVRPEREAQRVLAAERLGRQVLEELPEALVVCDAQDRVALGNAAAERLLGEDPRWRFFDRACRLEGVPVPPGAAGVAEAARQGWVVARQPAVLVRADRSRVDVQVSALPLRDAGGRELGCILTLVSAPAPGADRSRHAAELLELTNDAVFTWRPGGGVETWNAGAEKLYGHSAAAARGQPVHTLLHTRSAYPVSAMLALLREQGRWEGELTQRTADGRFVVVSARVRLARGDGGSEHVLEVHRDVTRERQAEDALRASELRYRSVFENSGNPLLLLGAVRDGRGAIQDWVYRDANEAALRQLGLSADAVLGRRVSEVAPGHGADTGAQWAQVVGTGRDWTSEQHLRGRDYLVRVFRVGESSVVSEAVDITALKQAQQAVAASEARFRAFFHTAAVGTAETDLQGLLTDVNERFCAITGFTRRELLGRHLAELSPPEEHASARQQHDERAQRGGVMEVETRFQRKDGARIWVRVVSAQVPGADGKPRAWAGVVEDVTARRTAEEDLARAKARLELAQEAGRIGTLEWDLHPGGTVLTHGMAVVYGVQPQEFSGSYAAWLQRVHPDDLGRVERLLQDVVQGRAEYNAEYRIHWPDGSVHWVAARGVLQRDPTGTPTCLVGVNMDVTEHHRLREQQQDLLRTISHDLRTPLGALLLQAQLMQRMLPPGDPQARRVGMVISNAQRLNAMIQDLVDMVHLERGAYRLDCRPVDLARTVVELQERLAGALDVARLRVSVQPELPAVAADPERLERVLVNLLTNALKFSPPGTPVDVELHSCPEGVRLAVTDRGVGISREDQPRLFQRFFRASSGQHTKGLGLGLYISSLLVQAHGGSLTVESEVGKGSTFTVRLPRASA